MRRTQKEHSGIFSQELGTLYQPAQPHLGAAFHEMEPYYVRDLAALIRSSITRHSLR